MERNSTTDNLVWLIKRTPKTTIIMPTKATNPTELPESIKLNAVVISGADPLATGYCEEGSSFVCLYKAKKVDNFKQDASD